MASAADFDLPEDDDTEEVERPKGNGLRDQLKEVLAKNKAMAQELEELRTNHRKTSLNEAFKGLGVDEKYARLYPADGDASVEAVTKWAQEFGFAAAEEAAGSQELSPEQVAAQRVAETANTATQPTGDLASQLASMSFDDLVKNGAIKFTQFG